jgi:uncharacterized protein YjbI with pentapeptide repeats
MVPVVLVGTTSALDELAGGRAAAAFLAVAVTGLVGALAQLVFASPGVRIKAQIIALGTGLLVLAGLLTQHHLVRHNVSPSRAHAPLDFRGQRLTANLLAGRNLRGSLLDGADLSHMNLSGRDLSGVRARGASFAHADLRNARLNGAELDGANLQDACLYDADLAGASLDGADATGADVSKTTVSSGQTSQSASWPPATSKSGACQGPRGG